MNIEKIKNFLYSKTVDSRFYTVYRILGLKFSFFNSKSAFKHLQKKVHFNSTDIMLSVWQTYGATSLLLREFEFYSQSQYAWRTYFPHFWLIYLSCLVETNQNQKAEETFLKYLQYRNGDLKDIDRFLLVANFAKSIGINNEEISRASFVYQELEKNRQNDIFKKIIEGKSIAVVGNGPSEIGKSKGAEIDNHDIVIRFNNYATKDYEVDYGTKTTIWARGSGGGDVLDRLEKYDLVTWEADYNHWRIPYNHLEIMERQIKEGQLIYNFDYDSHMLLRQASGIDFPTTGLVLIWEIYRKLGSLKNVDFYGFNFCKEDVDEYSTHYFNDRDQNEARRRSAVHNLNKEAVFMKKMLGELKNEN